MARRLDADLAAVAALVLLAILASLLPAPDWLRALLFVPLVLAVPGYAVAAALFPPGDVSRDERAVLTFAFSISAFALSGIVVQLVLDLDRGAWLVLLVLVTLGSIALAQARRPPSPAPRGRRPISLRPDPRLAALPVAAAIAALAVAVASGGAADQEARSHFSSLWLLPGGDGPTALTTEVAFGAENHEGRDRRYLLRLSRDDEELRVWRFTLADGERWERTARVSAVAEPPVVAALFRGKELFRRVALDTGSRG